MTIYVDEENGFFCRSQNVSESDCDDDEDADRRLPGEEGVGGRAAVLDRQHHLLLAALLAQHPFSVLPIFLLLLLLVIPCHFPDFGHPLGRDRGVAVAVTVAATVAVEPASVGPGNNKEISIP